VANSSASRGLRFVLLFSLLDARRLPGQELNTTPEPISPPVLGQRDRRLTEAVRNAVGKAAGKLEDPQCAQIFSDFRDSRGRTLQHNLEARGETGRGFLRWLVFYNGQTDGACRNTERVAATNPGEQLIRICRDRFLEVQFLTPGYAAALIIHEELHALGLKENPPTSREITAAVISRCGQ
jgi:hypothetical protein